MNSPIEYLKGVGPVKGELLKKEANIFTFKDLLEYYPFRYIDRTKITAVNEITPAHDYIQCVGRIVSVETLGEKRGRRLVATFSDGGGTMDLVWFQGIQWISKKLYPGVRVRVFGKATFFMNRPQLSHPERELITDEAPPTRNHLEPVYSTTEKLRVRGLGGREFAQLTATLLAMLAEKDVPENLPADILQKFRLMGRYQACCNIHFPKKPEDHIHAVKRLKFEELFFSQLRMGLIRVKRHTASRGVVFNKVGDLFNNFYQHYLPFSLTGAQKRVLKEIRKDLGSGRQMNRLLQGDVGSGKTMVALMAVLIAADNAYQGCFMAPTEILARQHYDSLRDLLKDMPVNVGILTGSTPARERKKILASCADGSMHIITGTHALIEDAVQFHQLGLAIIDEQHRFGVAQRARLWKKNSTPPHVLVMTATPIPRTLALTAYGDLDYSVMDELPPGRQPVTTVHRYEYQRPEVMHFAKSEIAQGRQVYLIYPLIEESSKLDYENLQKGYEEVKARFPEPQYYISMVHGRQKAQAKQVNMDRFVRGDTQIMVSTTVIEVGVNVPNASVMIIESADRFGLPQLHQLRGRVGRGSDKSYCILITRVKLSADARQRLQIMCETNDGFKIAEKDLEIRGPGDVEGTRQSGLLNFKLANIIDDRRILEAARATADKILNDDPDLQSPVNACIRDYLSAQKGKTVWSKIS